MFDKGEGTIVIVYAVFVLKSFCDLILFITKNNLTVNIRSSHKFVPTFVYTFVATLDLGNFQRFRGTRRFILKALCR